MQFSQAIDTKEKRVTQAKAVTELVVKYGFSGVDLDWEFPNAVGKDERDFPGDVGMMCYAHSPDDTENLCLFIAVSSGQMRSAYFTAGRKRAQALTYDIAIYLGITSRARGRYEECWHEI